MLDELVNIIPAIPQSLKETHRTYNHRVLNKVTVQNEISKFNFPVQLLERSSQLSKHYDDIAGEINRNGVSEDLINDILQTDLAVEDELEDELNLYTKQSGLSVKALYNHKIGHYQNAFDLTVECINVNDTLINKGVCTAILRNVEQNVNLSRIYYSKNEIDKSYQAWKGILDYLVNGTVNNIVGSAFKNHAVWEEIKYLREPCILEWFDLFLYYVLKNGEKSIEDEKKIFYSVLLDLEINISTFERSAIKDFINIKQYYFENQTELFVEDFVIFNEFYNNKEFDTLKLSLCQSLLNLIESNNYGSKNGLKIVINDFIKEKLILKQYLKDMVCN